MRLKWFETLTNFVLWQVFCLVGSTKFITFPQTSCKAWHNFRSSQLSKPIWRIARSALTVLRKPPEPETKGFWGVAGDDRGSRTLTERRDAWSPGRSTTWGGCTSGSLISCGVSSAGGPGWAMLGWRTISSCSTPRMERNTDRNTAGENLYPLSNRVGWTVKCY